MQRAVQSPSWPIVRHGALSRRSLLGAGAATLTHTAFSGRAARAAAFVAQGKVTLAGHTNLAPRWLDPRQHDGTATPDNFLMALHDGLVKNFRDELYDHPALAERFEFTEDAKSATFWLRAGLNSTTGLASLQAMSGGVICTRGAKHRTSN